MEFSDRVLKADMTEPLMVEWVLDRMEDALVSNERTVHEMVPKLFDDAAIAYMIENFDESLLARVFRILDPEVFLNHVQTIADRWPTWRDDVACWSAPVIARCDPDSAVDLFRTYSRKGDGIFSDLSKWHGMMKGLTLLTADTAKNLAAELIDAYQRAGIDPQVKQLYSIYIVASAWTYDHPEFPSVFRAHILPLPTAATGSYAQRLAQLVGIFEFSTMEFNVMCHMIESGAVLSTDPCAPFYRSDIPLESLDAAVKHIRKRSFDFMPGFLKDHGHVIENERIRTFFQDLVVDEGLMSQLHRKKQRPYLYAMVLSCLMASLRKDALDLTQTPMDEAVRLLSSPMESLPDPQSFISYFKERERQETIDCLVDALDASQQHFGGGHVIQVMSELGYDAFIEPLIRITSNRSASDMNCMLAESAIAFYGEKAIAYFTEHFDELTPIGRLSALTAAHHIGGPAAIAFVDAHFDTYWKTDKESLIRVCEAIGGHRFRDRLAPKVNKNQKMVDRAYIILSLLEEDRSPQVAELLQTYYAKRDEQKTIDQAVKSGNLLETIKPYIDAELRCRNCGDESEYRLHRIYMSDVGKGRPYIAEDIRCISCNVTSEFEFTRKGLMMLTGEMSRLMMFSGSEEKKEAVERSPIKIIESSLYGKAMDIEEAIEKFQEAVTADPEKPDPYIRLGNIYANTHQFRKADACFTKAVENDPSYLQPYFMLAQMAYHSGNPDLAINHLERGRNYLSAPRFVKEFESKLPQFISAFCGLHHALIKATRRGVPPIHPSDFKIKLRVGRNDPCPCGSGKKYKKCCLMKHG